MPSRGNEADRKAAQLSVVARAKPENISPIERKAECGAPVDAVAEPSIVSFFNSGRLIRFLIHDKLDHIQSFIQKNERFYEEQMLLDIARRLARPGPVIDVGANIGNHSVFFGLICDRHVIAIEPLKQNFAHLVDNVQINQLGNKVTCIHAAAGARPGRGEARVGDAHNLGTAFVQPSDNAGSIEILTLDRLDLAAPPALIKIDVEGMELDVLRGAAELLRKHNPLLYVEVTNKIQYDKISDWLGDLGYRQGLIFNDTPTILYSKDPEVLEADLSREYGYLAIDHMHARERNSLKRKEIERSHEELASRNVAIDTLVAKLEQQESQNAELRRAVEARDAALAVLSANIEDLRVQTAEFERAGVAHDSQTSKLTTRLEELEACNAQLKQELAAGKTEADALGAKLKAQTFRATNLEKALASREREIRKVKKSSSWRITKPLRVFTRGLREFLRSIRGKPFAAWQYFHARRSNTALKRLYRRPDERSLLQNIKSALRPPGTEVASTATSRNPDDSPGKVSVIMTTYNSASYLDEAVNKKERQLLKIYWQKNSLIL